MPKKGQRSLLPNWNEHRNLLPTDKDQVIHFVAHCDDWKTRAPTKVGNTDCAKTICKGRNNTALHCAIERLDMDSVSHLLNHGADLFSVNAIDQTPVQLAHSLWLGVTCASFTMEDQDKDTVNKLFRIVQLLDRSVYRKFVREPIKTYLICMKLNQRARQRLKWQSEEGNSSRKVAQVEDEHKEIISRVEKLPELAIHLDKQVLQVVKDFLW